MQETVIQTRGLTKYYGTKPVVDHLDIEIPRGSICGFLGRNGAGKTTTIKMLLGLSQPTAGSAQVLGCDTSELSPAIRQRIGYVTEGHRLLRWMTIKRLEQFQKAFYPEQWDSRFFWEMIEYFELSPRQKIKQLSNGQRAQVSLSLTLAPRPELLIMDDPTLGLDVAIRRQFLEGMISLIMQEGRTVLFSSHILGDVERVCDRMLVMEKGVLHADCSLAQFRQAVKKVRAVFPTAIPHEVDLPGLIHQRQNEQELELVLVNTPEDRILAWMEGHQAQRHEIVPLTLEDQFIEFTASSSRKRLFSWEGI